MAVEMSGWAQAVVATVVPAVGVLGHLWNRQAREVQGLKEANAGLTGRVTTLELARTQDLDAIRGLANTQTEILIKLEGILTEIRLTRTTSAARQAARKGTQ
jgi:hypothetical protein